MSWSRRSGTSLSKVCWSKTGRRSGPERNPQDWESLRAQDSKLDPKAIKAEVTALWQSAEQRPGLRRGA